MKKIATVVGARPQFIKAAMVSKAISSISDISEIIIHTGQHYDSNMSQIFFDELKIPMASYQLGIGSGSQGKQTGEMLVSLDAVLQKENPDCLLIYGDTNSTLAAALAAAKLYIPIAHVESGLRSYNRKMPEEINRIIADQLSSMLFTPTQQAVTNLKAEGYSDIKIIEVGDVMYDAALFYANIAEQTSTILNRLQQHQNQYILATIHRAENTDNLIKLQVILNALEKLTKFHNVIMPLHPRTRNMLEQNFTKQLIKSSIQIIEPVGFLDMIMLEKNAGLIITDSGGVQKESFFYRRPCITLRDETEWIETVQLGWNTVVRPKNADEIYDIAVRAFNRAGQPNQFPFGKGNAGYLIANHLAQSEFTCAFG